MKRLLSLMVLISLLCLTVPVNASAETLDVSRVLTKALSLTPDEGLISVTLSTDYAGMSAAGTDELNRTIMDTIMAVTDAQLIDEGPGVVAFSLPVKDFDTVKKLDGIGTVLFDYYYDGTIDCRDLGLPVQNGLYLNKLNQKIAEGFYPQWDNLQNYDEVYYHHDDAGRTDWAIIYAEFRQMKPMVTVSLNIGKQKIYLSGPEKPFTYRYGLYDVNSDTLQDLYTVSFDAYDDLTDVFQTLDLSAVSPAKLLGDADCDGDIRIFDVTCIQRYLADLDRMTIYETNADVDNDGEVTIFDATGIQRYLAGMGSL